MHVALHTRTQKTHNDFLPYNPKIFVFTLIYVQTRWSPSARLHPAIRRTSAGCGLVVILPVDKQLLSGEISVLHLPRNSSDLSHTLFMLCVSFPALISLNYMEMWLKVFQGQLSINFYSLLTLSQLLSVLNRGILFQFIQNVLLTICQMHMNDHAELVLYLL